MVRYCTISHSKGLYIFQKIGYKSDVNKTERVGFKITGGCYLPLDDEIVIFGNSKKPSDTIRLINHEILHKVVVETCCGKDKKKIKQFCNNYDQEWYTYHMADKIEQKTIDFIRLGYELNRWWGK